MVGLKIAVMVLVVIPSAFQAFDLPKGLLGRSLSWVALGLIASAVARYGTSVVPRSRIHLAVSAVVLSLVLSTAFAVDRYVAVFGEWDRFLGAAYVLDMAVLYLAITVAFHGPRDWVVLGGWIAGAGAVTVTMGLLQRAGVDPIASAMGVTRPFGGRPYGTFGNPDPFGQFLGPALGAAVAIAVMTGHRATRVVAIVASVVLLVTAAAVATRSVLLGVGSGTLVVLALLAPRMRRTGIRVRVIAALALVGAAALLLLLTPLGSRTLATIQGEGLQDRLLLWESALRMIGDRPLTGAGPDNFGVAYPPYRQPGTAMIFNFERETSAHSWPLHAAATLGLPGLAALCALIVATSIGLARAITTAPVLAGAALTASLVFWTQGLVSIGAVGTDWIPWVAAGAAVALRRTAPEASRAPRTSASLGVVAIVAAVAVALTTTTAIRADLSAGAASVALERGDLSAALRDAQTALSLDDGRSEYWGLLGGIHKKAERWSDALSAYSAAAERKPMESFYWQEMARSRSKLVLAGDRRVTADAALDAARHAVALDPNQGDPYYVLAVIAYDLRRPEDSLRAAVRAIQLRSRFTNADEYAAAAAAQVSDKRLVRSLLMEALRALDQGSPAAGRLIQALPPE